MLNVICHLNYSFSLCYTLEKTTQAFNRSSTINWLIIPSRLCTKEDRRGQTGAAALLKHLDVCTQFSQLLLGHGCRLVRQPSELLRFLLPGVQIGHWNKINVIVTRYDMFILPKRVNTFRFWTLSSHTRKSANGEAGIGEYLVLCLNGDLKDYIDYQ